MPDRKGGTRRKSRHKMMRPLRERGKLPIRKHMQVFTPEDKVILKAEPSYQHGMYPLAYHGWTANVKGKQGDCYRVEIKHDTCVKTFVVHPVHLKKAKA
jgi:ribosomal protein L21E